MINRKQLENENSFKNLSQVCFGLVFFALSINAGPVYEWLSHDTSATPAGQSCKETPVIAAHLDVITVLGYSPLSNPLATRPAPRPCHENVKPLA